MSEGMAFWSVILPAKGKEVKQEVESTDSVLSSIHLTGLALGVNPKAGPHPITLEYNGNITVLGTLEAPHTRQFHLDIALDETYKLRNLGDSEVHAYGFQVATQVRSDEHSDEDEDEEEDEEDEDEDEEDSEDDEETPKALKLRGRRLRRVAVDSPDGDLMDTDSEDEEDEEDEEGEEGDEDEDEEDEEDDESIPDIDQLGSDDMVAEADEDEDEEEEDEESEEEEETEKEETPAKPTAKVGSKRAAQTPQPGKAPKQAKQEPPKSAPPKQLQQQQQKDKQGGPRQIPVTLAGAEEKAQKGKGKEEKGEKAKVKEEKAPKGKEEKPKEQPKGVKTPATESEFRAALVDFLGSQKGPVPLSSLGTAVKKPAAVAGKLSAYLSANKDTFVVDDKGVSLKK
ncbi:hypothetical protein Agub_g9907 [Astrephomene gubernaculifera]|uniref:Nucleoplasmin-like domain-containing protein n=1 Tax=Astrephomene gubernaculifera TaxID=47775 RepID=A0AAD3DU60_9CHLO|nr:hypothetical protein Agub_g9907 [Astrephomene gubernaculifera]